MFRISLVSQFFSVEKFLIEEKLFYQNLERWYFRLTDKYFILENLCNLELENVHRTWKAVNEVGKKRIMLENTQRRLINRQHAK